MIVILMGAPGAGKGTQAEYLRQSKGFIKVSTGDLLRREVSLKTDLGKRVEAIMSQGSLVSDDILMEMMKAALAKYAELNCVLDGFPRTVAQADWLAGLVKVAGVIHVDVDREELIRRIEGRLICSSCEAVYHVTRKPPMNDMVCDKCGSLLKTRPDDTREKVLHRLDVYTSQTKPVLDYYKSRNQYFCVDGNAGEVAVSQQLDMLLSRIEH